MVKANKLGRKPVVLSEVQAKILAVVLASVAIECLVVWYLKIKGDRKKLRELIAKHLTFPLLDSLRAEKSGK